MSFFKWNASWYCGDYSRWKSNLLPASKYRPDISTWSWFSNLKRYIPRPFCSTPLMSRPEPTSKRKEVIVLGAGELSLRLQIIINDIHYSFLISRIARGYRPDDCIKVTARGQLPSNNCSRGLSHWSRINSLYKLLGSKFALHFTTW